MNDAWQIETKNLSFQYNRRIVVDSINLCVPKGSIYGYLGKNGAGKTTTLKLLLGLLPSNPDTIFFNGKNFAKESVKTHYSIGSLVESPALYAHLTAFEQLKYVDYFFKKGKQRILEVLDWVGLQNDKNKKINHFSTGMKQRLALAVALFHDPEMLILDEPINGLDPNGIYEIRELLLRINKQQNRTILFSSHILSEVEKICTHIGILDHGKLLFQGDIKNLPSSTLRRKVCVRTNKAEYAVEVCVANSIHAILENSNEFYFFPANDLDFHKTICLLTSNSVEIYSTNTLSDSLESIYIDLVSKKEHGTAN